MNYSGFGKTMENVQKHRYIKVATTTTKKKLLNYSVSEPIIILQSF